MRSGEETVLGLPLGLFLHVMSYLDFQSLLSVSMLSTAFVRLFNSYQLSPVWDMLLKANSINFFFHDSSDVHNLGLGSSKSLNRKRDILRYVHVLHALNC